MHAIANKQRGHSPSMIHPDGIASYTSSQHAVLDEFSDFTTTLQMRALRTYNEGNKGTD